MRNVVKKSLIAMMMLVSAVAMTITDADAKRLGGGGSVGRQSTNVSKQATPATNPSVNQARPATPAAAPAMANQAKPPSRWKQFAAAAIGGALLGGLLAHFGLGGALGSAISSLLTIALIAFAIMFVISWFRKRNNPAPAAGFQPAFAGGPSDAYNNNVHQFEPQPQQQPQAQNAQAFQATPPASTGVVGTWSVPADFDVPAFVRNAKTYFIRLQAAWDKADINDIREFTTTEMYAEIKLQIQERGASPNNTDVVSIDAELLGLETQGADYLASVKFTGMIKESPSEPVAPFAEVWNLTKPTNGQGGWVLAGIQQL